MIRPQPGPQEAFLASPADIAIYGGAAGGGKSWALLAEAARHIDVRGYAAVLFRRTTVQVRNAGGLWDESSKLYPLLGGEPRENVLDWRFPRGSSVRFAHLEHDKTVEAWQGSQIPMIGFDELTHFTARQFWYLVSRNRSTCGVRPYIRATCNPDADSWVAEFISWWIDPDTGLPIPERAGVLRWMIRIGEEIVWANSPEELAHHRMPTGEAIPPKSVTFIPAKLTDNQVLMRADPGYMANLLAQPTVERERLLGGNWKVRNTAALVFSNWSVEDFETPKGVTFRFGADWGYANDPTVLVRSYLDDASNTLFVDYEAQGVGIEIEDTPALFAGDCPKGARNGRTGDPLWENPNKHPGVPEAYLWPITADSARPETVSHMRRRGFRIVAATKGPGSIEDGVRFLQGVRIVVHPRCTLTAQELGRYSWKVDPATGLVLPVLEDKDNNAIDALRYAYEGVRRAPKALPKPKSTNPPDLWGKPRQAASSWKTA